MQLAELLRLGGRWPMRITVSNCILAIKLTKMWSHKLVDGKSTIHLCELGWYHTWGIWLVDFCKCRSIESILTSHSHRERIYFRMACRIGFFFSCAHVVFLSVLFLLAVSENNLSLADKKKVFSWLAKHHKLESRLLFTFRWNWFYPYFYI